MPKRYKVEAQVTLTDTLTGDTETDKAPVEEYDKESEARKAFKRKGRAISEGHDGP